MRILPIVIVGCIVAGTISASEVAFDAKPPWALEEALENLRNSTAEWRREKANFRLKRRSNSLSKADADEYATFVAGLHRQKLEDCEIVRQLGGNAALKGYDCFKPAGFGQLVVVVPPSVDSVKTESEKIGALETRLKRLEAELDEELLRKQKFYPRNAHNQNARGVGSWGSVRPGGGSSAGGGQGNSARGAGANGDAISTNPGSWSVENRTTAGSRNGQDGVVDDHEKSGNHNPGAGPGRISEENSPPIGKGPGEDGTGDNVVMRQIREAAEREIDPVLKEKLWAEYRKLRTANRI